MLATNIILKTYFSSFLSQTMSISFHSDWLNVTSRQFWKERTPAR